eukprot:gene11876-biopygen21431
MMTERPGVDPGSTRGLPGVERAPLELRVPGRGDGSPCPVLPDPPWEQGKYVFARHRRGQHAGRAQGALLPPTGGEERPQAACNQRAWPTDIVDPTEIWIKKNTHCLIRRAR